MANTRNDLPGNARAAMIALLNGRLVNAIDLRLALKQAHWNIKGPNFIALHEMLDEMQARVDAFADEIAERGVALGGVAAGTTQAVADGSKLAAYPVEITAERDHLQAVADRLSVFGKSAREAIDAADEAGDKDTADLFTEISRQIDKDLWFIEAHLQ